MDDGGDLPKDKTFLAFQKVFNVLRSDVKHLEEKVSELQKTTSTQANKIGKLNKEFSSLKEEYKNCVEALRTETEERTKAESTVKVLKEILESKEECKLEEKSDERMEINDALGIWITQQKRKPLKIARGKINQQNCGKCDKTFRTEKDLANHAQEHIKDLHVNNKEVTVSDEKCDQGFESSKELKNQIDKHSSSASLHCDNCDEIFVTIDEASNHKQSHDMDLQFKCEQCKQSFTGNDSLSEHMKTHKQVQEFQCCKCDKTYTTMNKLRRHDWRSHRNVECSICGEQLESRDQISTHRKIVHKMVKKIKCKFYPACFDEDECFFVHEEVSSQETEETKFCLDGENCQNQSCEFSLREHTHRSNILCRFQSKCSNPACRFRHVVEKASFLGDCTQNFKKK